MKVLLDTHAMIWWWTAPGRFRKATLKTLSAPDTDVLVSAISAYELAYKHRCGKLILPDALLEEFDRIIAEERWEEIPVTVQHTLLAGRLDSAPRDPFDRILAAQALSEGAWLATIDKEFNSFPGLKILW